MDWTKLNLVFEQIEYFIFSCLMKRGIPQLIDDPGMWLTNDINGYQRQEVDGKKVIEATEGFVILVRRGEHIFLLFVCSHSCPATDDKQIYLIYFAIFISMKTALIQNALWISCWMKNARYTKVKVIPHS